MNYIQIVTAARKYGRQYGPQAVKAWSALALLADKNPQLKRLSDQIGRRFAAHRPDSKLKGQIDMAKEFATEALTDQSVPERQELARGWTQRAKALDMRLRAAEAGPPKLAKERRADVAQGVDLLLMEIIETSTKWAES